MCFLEWSKTAEPRVGAESPNCWWSLASLSKGWQKQAQNLFRTWRPFTRTCFLSSAGFPVETNASHMAEADLPTLLWSSDIRIPPPTDSRCAQSSHPPLNRWSLPHPTLQDHHHTTRGPTTTWGSRERNLTEEGSEAAPVAFTHSQAASS